MHLANEDELDEIEEKAKQYVRDSKNAAWEELSFAGKKTG